MLSLRQLFKRNTQDAQERLKAAYVRVFVEQGASKEDKEIVLNDLLSFCGLYEITPASGDLVFNEGRRSVAHRILHFTQWDEVMKLEGFAPAHFETIMNDGDKYE